MTISNDWRLTPALDAFIVSGSEKKYIYLVATEKKQYKAAVEKTIGSPYKEIHIELNEFEVKFESPELESSIDPVVMVRNPEMLPDDSWYIVSNFYYPRYLDFFLELDSSGGEFPGVTFEAIFSETSPLQVCFSAPGMKRYKTYLEEMKRRINCEVKKKTKKWIPGHRYDTLKETYYFLGEAMSRREKVDDSEFCDPDKMVPVYLYVSDLRDDEKKISDVMNNRVYGEKEGDIRVLYSIPSSVESGEALEDDFGDDIRKYWDALMDNTTKRCTHFDNHGYETVEDIKKFFDIFCYQTGSKYDYPEEYKPKIESFLQRALRNRLVESWNMSCSRKDMTVGSSQDEKQNATALEKSLYFKTEDINSSRYAYYSKMMSALGVDIKLVIDKALALWDDTTFVKSFEEFYKNSIYFDLRKTQGDTVIRQRVSSTSYRLDVIKLESLFGTGELREKLVEIIDFSRENFGSGVSGYILYNAGTKKKPMEYVTIEITLDDLIKWVGGIDKLSDSLKSEIISTKFTRTTVIIDKDKEVE
jgi:hypothetical protein